MAELYFMPRAAVKAMPWRNSTRLSDLPPSSGVPDLFMLIELGKS